MELRNEEIIRLDRSFEPRPYQRAIFDAIENKGFKRAVLCWARRSGKDCTLWHLILRQALKRVGTYMYCLPTYSQAKSVIWQSIRIDGIRFIDMIPKELIYKLNESTMSVELINHSIIKLIGSDSYNTSLRGSNPLGIVFSEYAQADPDAFKASLAIVQANNGWIVVQSTPWGHNGFYDLVEIAKNNPKEWFYQHLTIEDTGHITRQQVENDIATGLISREFANQEYYCDFNLGVEGSYYAKYLIKMRLNSQIGNIPYESHYKTNTCWDLGVRDSTFILWYQQCGNVIHIFDCLEDSKKGLEHYCKEVLSRDYIYNAHVAPHDIKVQEFGTGATRIDIAARMGIDFTVADNLSIMDGIEAVRCNLSRIYIDEVKCRKLISCLENYSQEFDPKLKIYKSAPRHDAYSHGADCLRYLCTSLDKISIGTTAAQLDERYRKAMAGTIPNYGPFTQR